MTTFIGYFGWSVVINCAEELKEILDIQNCSI